MKFASNLAEYAYAIAGHGFADEHGTVEELKGWNACVDVSPVILRNVGEYDLADDMERAGMDQLVVWIREDAYGFVDVVTWAPCGGARESLVWSNFDLHAHLV